MKTKKMTVEGKVKVTPPTKKLKQARLPFQVLPASPTDSPPTPVSKSTQKKRKLSETSDDIKVVKAQRANARGKCELKENLRGVTQPLECPGKPENKKRAGASAKSSFVRSPKEPKKCDEAGNKSADSVDVICITDSENEASMDENPSKNKFPGADGKSSSSKLRNSDKKGVDSEKAKMLSGVSSVEGDAEVNVKNVAVSDDELALRVASVANAVADNVGQVKNKTSRLKLIKDYSAAVTGKIPRDDDVIVSSDDSETESEKSEVPETEDEPLKMSKPSEEDAKVDRSSLTAKIDHETPSKKTPPNRRASKSRNLTPKQLQKQLESAKKKEEKELQKQVRDKKRAEEREEKQRQLLQKKKEKEEKEEQKRKEKEEKERKRLAELELKNEERKVKEEERKAKEEERKAKEEERRKREEQKMQEKKLKEQAEEEVKRKQEKEAAAFTSFFVSKKAEPKHVDQQQSIRRCFIPFMVKNDMRLATICRAVLSSSTKNNLDRALKDQFCTELYLQELRSGKIISRHDKQTWPLKDLQDEVMIIDDVMDGMDRDNQVMESHPPVNIPHPKLLQFHENRRPPYWGTWTKQSTCIGPRRPFGKEEKLFDYDVDSDDEWEEEEPGESLNGSEDEKESEDEYEVDNDFFVPHGYLSDEENFGEEEGGQSPETMKAKLKFLAIEFEEERMQKTQRLKPGLIGCIWTRGTASSTKGAVGEQMQQMLAAWRAVYSSDGPIVLSALESAVSSSPSADAKPFTSQSSGKRHKRIKFPESAIPDLVKLIHGNKNGQTFLLREFLVFWLKHRHCEDAASKDGEVTPDSTPSLSKKSILNKIKEIATWQQCPDEGAMQGQMCWYVSSDVRSALGLSDLKAPNTCWTYSLKPRRTAVGEAANSPVASCAAAADSGQKTCPRSGQLITKFTKVMSGEERQKQLSSTADSGQPREGAKSKRKIIFPAASSPSLQAGRKRSAPVGVSKPRGLVKYLRSPRNASSTKTSPSSSLNSGSKVGGEEIADCVIID